MELPSTLITFVESCIPLAKTQNHEAVATLLRALICDTNFAPTVPPFTDVESSSLGWTLGGEHLCHRTDELTVMVLDTLPGVVQPPHDHEMRAIIGVFDGVEEQRFFARSATGATPTPGRTLEAGDVMVLGERAIHAISAPRDQPARAIHVYFGDIYKVERSLFHPETLEEHAYSGDLYDEFCRPAT